MGCLKGVGGQKGNSQTSWGLQRQDPKPSSLPPSGHSFLLALSFSIHLQFPPFCHLSDDPKIATSTPKSVWAFSPRTLHQSDNTPCVSQIKFLKERSRLARNIYGWSLPLGHLTTPVPWSQIVIIGDRWVTWHRGLQAGGRAAMVSYRMFEVETEFRFSFKTESYCP